MLLPKMVLEDDVYSWREQGMLSREEEKAVQTNLKIIEKLSDYHGFDCLVLGYSSSTPTGKIQDLVCIEKPRDRRMVTSVFGRPGSGKSVLAWLLLDQLNTFYQMPCVYVDRANEGYYHKQKSNYELFETALHFGFQPFSHLAMKLVTPSFLGEEADYYWSVNLQGDLKGIPKMLSTAIIEDILGLDDSTSTSSARFEHSMRMLHQLLQEGITEVPAMLAKIKERMQEDKKFKADLLQNILLDAHLTKVFGSGFDFITPMKQGKLIDFITTKTVHDNSFVQGVEALFYRILFEARRREEIPAFAKASDEHDKIAGGSNKNSLKQIVLDEITKERKLGNFLINCTQRPQLVDSSVIEGSDYIISTKPTTQSFIDKIRLVNESPLIEQELLGLEWSDSGAKQMLLISQNDFTKFEPFYCFSQAHEVRIS